MTKLPINQCSGCYKEIPLHKTFCNCACSNSYLRKEMELRVVREYAGKGKNRKDKG